MKKISFLLMSLVAVFTLTGCGTKTVSCTKTEDGQKQIMAVTFKGNEVTKLSTEMSMEVEKDQIDDAFSFLQLSANAMQGKPGVKVSTSKDDNSISMKMDLELSKLDKETKETIDFDLEDTPKGPEEFIKEMTEDGYTCK